MSEVILISGKQGSGKTTTAEKLQTELRKIGFAAMRERFAGAVYLAHDAVYAALAPIAPPGVLPTSKKDGKLLQVIGTEWGRSLDPDIWIKFTKGKFSDFEQRFSSTPSVKLVFIVEDTRFKNEFDAFPEAITVRLECPEEIRKTRTESWRKDTGHESEVSLDEYVKAGKFDLVYDTSKDSVDVVVDGIIQKLRWRDEEKALLKETPLA